MPVGEAYRGERRPSLRVPAYVSVPGGKDGRALARHSNAMSPNDSEATRPDASVIVVTHNNESLIADCLRAIRAGLHLHNHEIIVVDNCSTDGTLAAIPKMILGLGA